MGRFAERLRYGIRLTGTTIKNEVISLGGKRIASGDIGAGKSVQMTEEGKPIKYFYGYNVIGIFQNEAQIKEYNEHAAAATGNSGQQYQNNVGPGDLIYEDVDGDGYITANDRKYLGSPTPKFIGGLGISAYGKDSTSLSTSKATSETRYSMPSRWNVSPVRTTGTAPSSTAGHPKIRIP